MDRLLDATVVASFDARGFRRHAARFAHAPTRDLTGRRLLVTGGTAGIGRAACEALADAGAVIETWGRRADVGEAAAASFGGRFRAVDLGDLDAVAAAAAETPTDDLAGVVLNAGAMPLERRLTPQGHELIWASQVLGHLLLLRILHARGALGPDTRVLWVSSGGMYLAPLQLSDLRREAGYARHAVYANAKRAQVELARHLAAAWRNVPQASMHPGWVDTDAVAHSMPVFRRMLGERLRTPAQGADTIVWWQRTADPGPSGAFWFDRQAVSPHVGAWTHTSQGKAQRFLDRVWADTSRHLPAALVPRHDVPPRGLDPTLGPKSGGLT